MTETPKLLCKETPPPKLCTETRATSGPSFAPSPPSCPTGHRHRPSRCPPLRHPREGGVADTFSKCPRSPPLPWDWGRWDSELAAGHPPSPSKPPLTLNTWEEGSSASDFGCPHAVPGPRFDASPVPVGAWPHTPKTLPPPQVSAAPRQPGDRRLFAPLPVWGEQWLWDGGPTASAPSSSWDAVS